MRVGSHGLASVENDGSQSPQHERDETNGPDDCENLPSSSCTNDQQQSSSLLVAESDAITGIAASGDETSDTKRLLVGSSNDRSQQSHDSVMNESNNDDASSRQNDAAINSKSTPAKTVTINEPNASPIRPTHSAKMKRNSGGFFRTLFSCGGSCGGGHGIESNRSASSNSNHTASRASQQQSSAGNGGARAGASASHNHLHNFLDELGSYLEKANRKVKIIHDLRANLISHHPADAKGHQRSVSNHETELSKSSKHQSNTNVLPSLKISDDSQPMTSNYNRKSSVNSNEDLNMTIRLQTKQLISYEGPSSASGNNLAGKNETDEDEEEENESQNDDEEYDEDQDEDEEEEEDDDGITDGDFVDDEEHDEDEQGENEDDDNMSNEGDYEESHNQHVLVGAIPNLMLPESCDAKLNDGSSQDNNTGFRDSTNKNGGVFGDANNTMPSFSFEEIQKSPVLQLDDYDDNQEPEQQPKQKQINTDYFSKFLTPNNILTDRGCIVNLRTGSFNLGCQQSCSNDENLNQSISGNSTEDSSNKGGKSPLLLSSMSQQPLLGSHRNEMINSLSFQYDRSSSPLGEKLNDFSSISMMDNAGSSNLVLIPLILIKSRQKITDDYENEEISKATSTLPSENNAKSVSSQIARITSPSGENEAKSGGGSSSASPNLSPISGFSKNGANKTNFLSVGGAAGAGTNSGGSFLGAPDQQDQARRCSHDPNIEKLHKNYINNVKLNAVAPNSSISVSTTTTDSASNMQVQSCGSAQTVSSIGSAQPIKKSGSKKVKKDSAHESGTKIEGLTRKESRKSDSKRGHNNEDKSASANTTGDMKGSGMDSEESDVVNDISKVTGWLEDNKYHHNRHKTTDGKDSSKKSNVSLLVKSGGASGSETCPSRLTNAANINNTSVSSSNQDDDDENDEIGGRTGANWDTPFDSAIEADPYGSVSTLSKTSSGKSRVNWPSFTKYYHAHFFQSIDTTWSKYQISAMSLEQIMALRKLALIEFSKLLEQQHSLLKQIFSKKRGLDEFKRVYDSIDSINGSPGSKSDAQHKTKSHSSNKDTDNINSTSNSNSYSNANPNAQRDSIIIDKRKVSHQLGAQIGAHPNTNVALQNRKKRNKRSIKKQEQQLLLEKNQMQLKHRLNNSQNPELLLAAETSGVFPSLSTDLLNQTDLLADPKSGCFEGSSTGNAEAKPKQVPIATHVFGLALSTIMQQTGQPLPQRILEAMRFLRKVGSNEVGIFRKNGVKTRINRLKELIDLNEQINFQSNEYTVFDIADTVKLYFRELPECLITNKLSDILLSNYSSKQIEQRKSVLQQLMLLIPDENRLVLQTLLLFLSEIAKHDKKNQMTLHNLAVCFSPVIFHLNIDSKLKLKPKRFSKTASKAQPEMHSSKDSPTLVAGGLEPNSSSQSKLSTGPANINQSKSNPHLSEKNEAQVEAANSASAGCGSIVGSSSFTFNEQRSSNNSLQDSQLSTIVNNESQSTNDQHTSKSSLNSAQTSQMTSTTNIQQAAQQQTKTLNATQNALQVVTPLSKTANYKRKCSDTINKAASSIVHFSTGLSELTSSSTSNTFFSNSSSKTDNLQIMSKVVQQCVADMIQYSMDLFTVPVENFEKLRLSATLSSEPRDVEYFYDMTSRKLKRSEFFKSNVNIDKMFWSYLGKHEDVSIYYFKNDQVQQLQKIQQQQPSQPSLDGGKQQQQASVQLASSAIPGLQLSSSSISSTNNINASMTTMAALPSSLFIPQQFENFNDRLKLWKCCTLVKHPNLTAEKIMNRIKNERYLWDDDFKEGKSVEQLDNDTDLYRYVINFMPPHPSRDFFEIRHWSRQEQAENSTIIITSSSVNHSKSKLVGDIRANLLISKYVIEKLIATDTTTTFKITHYVKLDYKGFSLEFYNRTFGYMMARLLNNLKQSLTNCV